MSVHEHTVPLIVCVVGVQLQRQPATIALVKIFVFISPSNSRRLEIAIFSATLAADSDVTLLGVSSKVFRSVASKLH